MHLPRAGGWHVRTVQVFPLKPGDFALGSSQSRAAARAVLDRRNAARRRIDVVSSIPRPGAWGEIRIGTWIEGEDGVLFRFSTIPPGMTIQEAERIVAQPGWKPTDPPAKPDRIRPPLKPEW
jgi:hypothetical protein